MSTVLGAGCCSSVRVLVVCVRAPVPAESSRSCPCCTDHLLPERRDRSQATRSLCLPIASYRPRPISETAFSPAPIQNTSLHSQTGEVSRRWFASGCIIPCCRLLRTDAGAVLRNSSRQTPPVPPFHSPFYAPLWDVTRAADLNGQALRRLQGSGPAFTGRWHWASLRLYGVVRTWEMIASTLDVMLNMSAIHNDNTGRAVSSAEENIHTAACLLPDNSPHPQTEPRRLPPSPATTARSFAWQNVLLMHDINLCRKRQDMTTRSSNPKGQHEHEEK